MVRPVGGAAAQRLASAINLIADRTSGRSRTGTSHEDADDTAGSLETDDAIGFDPIPLLRALSMCGASAVVMGQVAGIMHGSRELTGDLDLLWSGDRDQAPAMAEAFASVGAKLTAEDGAPIPCDAAAFLRPKVYFRTPTASGDCCTPALPWGDLDIDGIIGRADEAVHDGMVIRFASRPDLMSMRLAAGRPKDLRRAGELAAGPEDE